VLPLALISKPSFWDVEQHIVQSLCSQLCKYVSM